MRHHDLRFADPPQIVHVNATPLKNVPYSLNQLIASQDFRRVQLPAGVRSNCFHRNSQSFGKQHTPVLTYVILGVRWSMSSRNVSKGRRGRS